MGRILVRISGQNFRILVDEKPEKLGFFTAVFLDADSYEEAEALALNIIRDDLGPVVLNDRSDSPVMHVDEIVEVVPDADSEVGHEGYTWFSEDEEQDSPI